MSQYSKYRGLLPEPDYKENLLAAGANNADIIQALVNLAPEATKDVVKFAQVFKKDSTRATAFAIWYFLRNRAKYVRDSSDRQQIRLPRRFIADTFTKQNSGDCKSFSLFTIAILRALGLPAYLKFAAYKKGMTKPSHVYAFTKDENGKIIFIDGCYPYFDREKKPTFTKIKNMDVTSLSGTATATTQNRKALAQKMLAQMSPRDRNRVLAKYKERCLATGRAAYVEGRDRYGNSITELVISDEVIAGKKKKKPKLTKEQKKERRKKRAAKAKKGLKKFAWGVAFVNLAPIRAAFTAIVAANFNALAHNLKTVYDNRNGTTKKEWEKIEKVWYNIGGLKKALLKAIKLGAAHKPLFLSKKAKERFNKRKKAQGSKISGISLEDIEGIGAAPVIAAALAAAAGVIAAIIPAVMQGLKKSGNNQAAAEVQAQGEQMVQDYKAQGSPQPLRPEQVGQGAPASPEPDESAPESEDSEEVSGVIGAMSQDGLTSLFDTLGKVAQVGIQAAGTAVAKKAKKNPKLQKVLNAGGNAADDYFTGRYLREAGYTGAAKKYSKAAGTAGKYGLIIGGVAVLGLFGVLLLKKR